MRLAFTLIEIMIVVLMIAIIATIAIPNLVESREKEKNKIGTVGVAYRDIVGKTFQWNGNKTLIVDYSSDWKYVVVIMPKDGGAVNVTADRQVIMDAYKASLTVPVTVEMVER